MIERIKKLKEEKNAIILAHYYTNKEIQEVADYVGDSFYLAKVAKNVLQDTIVFCGVYFMGESAKILNPNKKVLMPDLTADCPMAHMVKENFIKKMRKENDDLAVVCYINSTADLKCESDVCVTSSNAVKIVKRMKNKNIFFIPDQNLGQHVKSQVPEKNVILNDGYCPIHKEMNDSQVLYQKNKYPNALVLSHPECSEDVLELSDFIGSTADIINFAKSSNEKEFIVCTEVGVINKLQKDNPEKDFYFVDPCPICINMKKNTLEKIIKVLETGENEINVTKEQREKALIPLERMLELGK